MKKTTQRDAAVSLARIIGMLFIVACHIGNYFSNPVVSQIFNVGVPLFFAISGGLYADRTIDNPSEWLINRILRLYKPLAAWILYSIISLLLKNGGCLPKESIGNLLLLLFNLQGLNHLFPKFKPVNGPWFFTIIMLCYLLLIPYKKIEEHNKRINSWSSLVIMFGVTALFSIGEMVDLSGIFFFFGGYILTAMGYNDKDKNHSILTALILIVGSCGIRIVGKYLFDDLWVYNDVIVLITHFAFAFGIMKSIRWLRGIKKSIFDQTMSSAIMKWIDKISIYVYCFHDIFIAASFSLNFKLIPSIFMVYIASFVSASIICVTFEALGTVFATQLRRTS